ncbi:MAG: transglycosylase SLT domain-containing protein [Burkholderiaceae bacterium]|nr:transglycosylase SLT domain-containing protein [Burkholderiaceae bacterium]
MEEPVLTTPPHAPRPFAATAVLQRVALLLTALLITACATAPVPQPTEAPVLPGEAPPVAAVAPVAAAPATAAGHRPAAARSGLIAIDPLQPTERLDLDAPSAQTDLWIRLRQGTALPDLDNDLVRKWEQWYASRPDYVQRMTERGSRYLFNTVEEVSRRGLPTELALLPFIESAYNPQAMSTAKASGMWQFVPATGRDFALTQNLFRDDRRDVLASTRAALDYLQTLHGMFGDWQLALAAYNWGQGNVQRAIARNQKAGLSTDYDSLRMPDETRNYLPKLQAVKNIVMRPDAYGLTLPALKNHPYFVSVGLERDIDIDLAARLAGLPLDEFKQLNPQMNKPVILAAGTPQVLLPYDAANRFVRALGQHRGTMASWTAWLVPRTLKPAEAARLAGMDEAQLRAVNDIPKGMLVKQGSTLLVPRAAHRADDVAEHIADNAVLTLAPDLPPLRRVSFKAGRKGDSVRAVAQRYGVNPVMVAQWNDVAVADRFKPGQAVVVMVPNKPAAARPSNQVAAKDGVKVAARGGSAKKLTKPAPTARIATR